MASKRRLRRKACDGKRSFKTDAAARYAIFRLRRNTGTTDPLTTYRCKFCNQFHFGHPPRHVRNAMGK